ncbi:MAG TPA: hypothetical protein DDX39_12865 [Bacteroidales bacterium]|nr:MAG: hypothetical protein A2W98_02600 [Bacteroidetes bacterium GWF2_33_38]OFY73196.1 MAG: hypothetical protein A2265_04565 [Bacteroidetes bacterium RIFOXYA12_FULL_33_9]OFY90196.1 MAG: hypothetical protein A2236_10950 [Bacteroidetes bacterium RIFOXYA2_FULL_33_7]HBF89523.1 hypothetical protein [Bacteroidales bacterium]
MLSEKLLQKFEIIHTEEYKSETYKIFYAVFKERFLYINFKGFSTNNDLIKGFEIRNRLITQFGFNEKEYFEIWDYIHSPKTSRDGRFIINENLSKENPNLLAILFTNCSLQQEVMLHSGFSFIKNNKTINTILKTNEEGIEFGLNLLKSTKEQRALIINALISSGDIVRNYVKSNFNDLWNKNKEIINIASLEYKVLRFQNNIYFSDSNLFYVNFDVIEENILKIDFSGIVKNSDIDTIFKYKSDILKELGLNKSTIYQIFDFTNVKFQSKSKIINNIISHLLEPIEINNISIFVSKSLFINQYLRIKNKKGLNKWMRTTNFENAFHKAYIIKELFESETKISIPKQKKEKDILINLLQSKLNKLGNQHKFDIEQIIKFISQIAWDKQSKPISIDNNKNPRLNNIFYAIKLVLEDNNDNINKLKGNISDLETQNSILAQRIKELEHEKVQKTKNVNINFELN